MRESNFAFPAQNKACVCITSQLYDRRALDTTSPLPLFNSLTHLTYLTSTSPRIREIMTMDGGLERLVRILHEFCICPPPPDNPAVLYGLTPPKARPPKLIPTLNPHSFDKHAAYRFSLAFQCVVNIGVRGSEPIRSRVVQAGTLDVVGCILEAWLANKGFALGPSSSATGLPRETREQRQARRTAHVEQRQREDAAQLSRALSRQIQMNQLPQRAQAEFTRTASRSRRPVEQYTTQDDDSMDMSSGSDMTQQTTIFSDYAQRPPTSHSNSDTDVSTDTSTAATPLGSGTPTGSVVIPSRDRSGTIIARTVWDPIPQVNTNTTLNNQPARHRPHRNRPIDISPPQSTDTSRPETETEDDGDGDIDMDHNTRVDSDVASASASPSPERHPRHNTHISLGRRAVGIVTDGPQNPAQVGNLGGITLDTDAHIIINEAGAAGDGVDVGVEDGIVSLEPNDDFAMGAPPGAPGAMDEGTTPRGLNLNMDPSRRRNTVDAPDVTPRAGVIGLPMMAGASTATIRGTPGINQLQQGTPNGHQRNGTIRVRPNVVDAPTITNAGAAPTNASMNNRTQSNHHHRDIDSGPYGDEDVLLSLQLLAYLSKYPHVRQAFYKPRASFHPASTNLPGARYAVSSTSGIVREKQKEKEKAAPLPQGPKDGTGYIRPMAGSAARGKERAQPPMSQQSPIVVSSATTPSSIRQTNVFSLVERFTFKPSSTETDLPNPPPRLPQLIQYWAGVIMRNACRKDDSRGGIRQCANMLCGKWETYPREFAKCRRCRKAKYCGKECQSTAWSEGHRFWCSAKDADEETTGEPSSHSHVSGSESSGIHLNADASTGMEISVPIGGVNAQRTERRERERDRHAREHDRAQTHTTAAGEHMTDMMRPSETARARPTNVPTIDTYLTLGNQEQGVRRRSETVTGVISSPGANRSMDSSGTPLVIPPHRPHIPLQPVTEWYSSNMSPTAFSSPTRGEPGPSRHGVRRADMDAVAFRQSTSEDQDMVLG